MHQCPSCGLIPLYKALTPRKGDAASVRRQSRQRLRSERATPHISAFSILTAACTGCECLPEIAPKGTSSRFALKGATAPLGPRNDTSGGARGAPVPSCGLIPLYKALAPRKGDAASVRRQSRQRLRSERRYRRNRCVPLYRYSMRAASVAPGEACLAPTTHDWQPCSTFHSPFSTKKIPDLRPGIFSQFPFKYSNL